MDRTETFRQITRLAAGLEDDDLRAIIEFLGEDYKARRKRAAQQAALALRPGDEVESVDAGRKLQAGARGHVTEVRGGVVTVHLLEHGMWRLDATLLRQASPSPRQASA